MDLSAGHCLQSRLSLRTRPGAEGCRSPLGTCPGSGLSGASSPLAQARPSSLILLPLPGAWPASCPHGGWQPALKIPGSVHVEEGPSGPRSAAMPPRRAQGVCSSWTHRASPSPTSSSQRAIFLLGQSCPRLTPWRRRVCGGCVCRGLCPRACAYAHWEPGTWTSTGTPDCPLLEPSLHFSVTVTASVTDGHRRHRPCEFPAGKSTAPLSVTRTEGAGAAC